MVTKDKRFRDQKSEGPGPGAYEVCRLVFLLKTDMSAQINNFKMYHLFSFSLLTEINNKQHLPHKFENKRF